MKGEIVVIIVIIVAFISSSIAYDIGRDKGANSYHNDVVAGTNYMFTDIDFRLSEIAVSSGYCDSWAYSEISFQINAIREDLDTISEAIGR